MSTLPADFDESLFDIRKVERFIAEGRITREQYQAYVDSLEDCSADADTSTVRFVAGHGRTSVGGGEPHPDEDEG